MPFTELEAALFARKRNRNRIELLPKVKTFLDSIARNSIKSKKSFLWPVIASKLFELRSISAKISKSKSK
jgi:hypothetical protein